MNGETRLLQVDYGDPEQGRILVELLDEYARHPMGGGRPLPQETRDRLVRRLAEIPGAFSLLAFVDGRPAGLANCFAGFSTFACRPLVNVHDLVVAAPFRGQGLAGRILEKVEEIARRRGCCKVTLEVLEGNEAAQRAYRRAGFVPYQLDPAMGRALFWEKKL